jgi:hypothetical protein
MGRVRAFISDLATRNATPFLHRQLYKDEVPQCIISCFTVSVLYANHKTVSPAMVMLALHSNVRQLIDAEASRFTTATPLEMLARTQALFFYQIIRLFDGDVILRAQGEKDMALLQVWVGELCGVRDSFEDEVLLEDGIPAKQPPKGWKVSYDTIQLLRVSF